VITTTVLLFDILFSSPVHRLTRVPTFLAAVLSVKVLAEPAGGG
jgi:hypothetical protein